MVEARTYAEHEGDFGDEKPSDRRCPKCNSPMTVQVWESNCGGYEDEKFTCKSETCHHYFWIDGIDS